MIVVLLALLFVFSDGSAACSLPEASEIHAVDAYTVFEGRKVGLRFDAAGTQGRVLQQHRKSLLETFFENLGVETVDSHKQNKLVSHILSSRKTFELFKSSPTRSMFYISWYPRALMNDWPAQRISFGALKGTFRSFFNNQQATLFRSFPSFVEKCQELFPRDRHFMDPSVPRETHLFHLEFIPSGKLKMFPRYAWNIEWTVFILMLSVLSSRGAEGITPSYISALFPGSKLVPLRNDTANTIPIASDVSLFSAFEAGDEISAVVNVEEPISFYSGKGLIYPMSGFFTPKSGVLVAVSPEPVWHQGAIIGYMLQLSQRSCKIRPQPISVGIKVPKGFKNLPATVLYEGLVNFAKSQPLFNLWHSIHKRLSSTGTSGTFSCRNISKDDHRVE